MSNLLSSFVDNLSEGFLNDKCTDCNSCLEYISTEDELLMFDCLKCSKSYKNYLNKDFIKSFANTCEFCHGDIIKFCLMLGKGVYSYEYVDSWKRFDKTSLPKKDNFYSNLNLEDITDADYEPAKKYGMILTKKVWNDNIMICIFRVLHYCFEVYWKTFKTNVLRYMNLILLIFIGTWISMASKF